MAEKINRDYLAYLRKSSIKSNSRCSAPSSRNSRSKSPFSANKLSAKKRIKEVSVNKLTRNSTKHSAKKSANKSGSKKSAKKLRPLILRRSSIDEELKDQATG